MEKCRCASRSKKVIVRVRPNGTVEPTPHAAPGLQTAEVDGSTLVGLVAARRPALVRLDSRGRVIRRTALRDASAQLAVSGPDAWFLGDGGQGERHRPRTALRGVTVRRRTLRPTA